MRTRLLAFIATWGASTAARTRRMERDVPILTYSCSGCTGAVLHAGKRD